MKDPLRSIARSNLQRWLRNGLTITDVETIALELDLCCQEFRQLNEQEKRLITND